MNYRWRKHIWIDKMSYKHWPYARRCAKYTSKITPQSRYTIILHFTLLVLFVCLWCLEGTSHYVALAALSFAVSPKLAPNLLRGGRWPWTMVFLSHLPSAEMIVPGPHTRLFSARDCWTQGSVDALATEHSASKPHPLFMSLCLQNDESEDYRHYVISGSIPRKLCWQDLIQIDWL